MTIRDWVGMLFFFPGVLLQFAAMRICGPHGRKLINEAVSDAARKMFRERSSYCACPKIDDRNQRAKK